jgi:hypothetical protein
MVIEHEDMIKQYYEKVKDQYPHLSYQQFANICKAPFQFVKEGIRSGTYPRINLKYMGKFEPRKGRLKQHLIRIGIYEANGSMSKEDYEIKSAQMKKAIADLEAEDAKLEGFDEIDIINDTITGVSTDTN